MLLDRTTPPTIRCLEGMKLPDVARYSLPNGVKLTEIASGTQQICRIVAYWPVGSMYYPDKAASHMHNELAQNGSAGYAPGEFQGVFEYHGAWFSTATYVSNTMFTLTALNSSLAKVLPTMRQAIVDGTFRAGDLESLSRKAAYKQSVKMKGVAYQAEMAAIKGLYGDGHPRSSMLMPEKILEVNLDDVHAVHRSKILGITPEIFVAGMITDEVHQLVEATFGDIAFGNASPGAIVRAEGIYETKRITVPVDDAVQSAINMAIPIPGRKSPDYERLRLATFALGGYFGSRLMSNIREDKGYTYGIYSGIVSTPEASKIGISCQADDRYVEDIIKQTEIEIDRLSTELMPSAELNVVKQMFMSTLTSVLDTPFNTLDYYISLVANGETPDYYTYQIDNLNALTAEEVRRVIREYVAPVPRLIAIAGK